MDCACGLLVDNNRILLGLRTADRRIYPNDWDVIGCHVEPGETLDQALIREVEEEVGVTPTAYTRLTTIAEPNPETNGVRAYHMYEVRDWRGGTPRLRGDDGAALGSSAVDFARQFQVQYGILSIGAIDGDRGLMDAHLQEAEFSRMVIRQAEQVIVASDHSKFGQRGFVKVCDLTAIDTLITDRPPPPAFLRQLADVAVEIACRRAGCCRRLEFEPAVVADFLHDEKGAGLAHPRQGDQPFAVKPVEVLDVLDPDLEEIVEVAGDEIAFQHKGETFDRGLEVGEAFRRRAVEHDADDDQHTALDLVGIDEGRRTGDVVVREKPMNATVAGRRAERHPPRQFGIADPGIGLQFTQQTAVDFVQHDRINYVKLSI